MSLSVIHLSDIHIKGENDLIFKRVEKLKAACVSVLPHKGNVIIAISGDIAYSGKEEQYYLAKRLFSELADYIKTEKDSVVDIVVVPGNHDCDFDRESSVRNVLVDSVKPSGIDIHYYKTVNDVQQEFRTFVSEYEIDPERILPIKEFRIKNNRIAFVLANTAWMSVIKENPGKIVMPVNQFESIDSSKYKIVFYMYHHPEGWLNQNCKKDFIDYVRQNADFILVGHEHTRDSYTKMSSSFSVFCNHGKELQDSNSDSSAFSVINFDGAFQTYEIIDLAWNGELYKRQDCIINQYHKNIASNQNIYHPNQKMVDSANDLGMLVTHFAKENVTLSDIFVWPDISKNDYRNEKGGTKIIRTNVYEELSSNVLNILVATNSGGKTSVARQLFLLEEPKDSCCLLLNGKDFTSSEETNIRDAVELGYMSQYSEKYLDEFNQLPKNKRTVIVDDFDFIKFNNDRRARVLDYLCNFFGRVTILLSSSIELPSILTSEYVSKMDQLVYYDILPLGNAKRKALISKWYHLDENTLTEDEISERVEKARNQMDIFLGNGAAFIPAMPVFVIGTLQSGDAISQSFTGSKYGYLYETLISSGLSKVSSNYSEAGMYNIDESILSKLAFGMLRVGKTSFTEEQLDKATAEINDTYILRLSSKEFLSKMLEAKIVYKDLSEGEVYRFKYPYIFYYFSGRYIAYNLDDKAVKEQLEWMSSRLYNETYGNIMIFVCHFAGSKEVIDNILINAYETLSDYSEFDFTKSNPIFDDIKEAVNTLIPDSISSNSEVPKNKERKLLKLDEAGINDGRVNRGEEIIDDEISEKEKELAAVVAAHKTIEVLGQILQNYPMSVKGPEKIEIINEMRKLGMRSVQAIINTMGLLEEELIEFIYERVSSEKENVRRKDIADKTRLLVGVLISGMARGMVHQVAMSLNSEHLLGAATKTFEEDTSVASKLVLLDLKMNCLHKFSYGEVQGLKRVFDNSSERFASRILDSIVAQYLNYNKCDHSLRSRLCELCGLSQQKTFIEQQKNLIE